METHHRRERGAGTSLNRVNVPTAGDTGLRNAASVNKNPAWLTGILRFSAGSDERHAVLVNDHSELIFIGTEINELIITGPEGTDLLKVFDIQAAVPFREPVLAALLSD